MRGTTGPGDFRTGLLGVVLLGLAVFNVLYLRFMAQPGQPKRKHLTVATLAYLIWTYAIGGFWTELGLYHPAIASILLVFVTLGSGLVVPIEGEK